MWLSHHFQNTENSALTNADVMTYTHVVKGFLHAARPLSPATVELCVDLAVKLSSVKVCFAKHFIDISVQLFRISF